ncbi:c-type cytochrome [Algoriphagus machipongonensis]|uniref:Cytochrome c family protein n=1 Tax=Algoriphagus machipongonensis TaxID=388413 RepID=A3HWN9_9BACT|nr:cytochrome c [Algoriphagus machipongonensis]EAZ81012.1 cytochrome c family protein [Algoriphagus machipongonensis]
MIQKILVFGLLAFMISCAPKSSKENNPLAEISDPEVMKYAIAGKTLYENHCANCHQSNGEGLGNLIPPLKDADYFKESIHRSVRIMKFGQKGEIQVNGKTFNQDMPANPRLTPLDIAQISTYLYNIWGLSEGKITSSDVENYLKNSPEN